MADERVIKTTIELDGEKAFKSALSSINSEMRVFDSELKLVTAQFGKSDQGMKGLQATADVLTKKVEEQKNKVNMLKTAVADSGKAYDTARDKYSAAEKKLEEMTATFGQNSEEARRATAELNSAANEVTKAEKAYNDYQVQLNNTQAALIKTTDELEKTSKAAKDLKNIKLKDLMPEKVAEEVEKVAKAFGKVATEAGKAAAAAAKIGAQTIQKSFEVSTKALTAYATAASTAATAIVKLTGDAALFADDMNTLATQTGLSTTELQKMKYAADLIDVDVETVTKSMAKLTKNMTSTSKQVTAAFDTLGVSVRDNVTGELRDNKEVFTDVIAALGEVENETERDNLAMQIFGKSAQELNPLIEGGADALKELGDSAEKAGLILSQDALDSLNAYNDSLDVMKANIAAAGNVIATSFAPRLQELTDKIGQSIPSLAGLFGQMFSGDNAAGVDFRAQVGKLVDDLLADVNDMLPDLLNGLNTVILTIGDNVPKAVTKLLPQFITGLKNLALGVVNQIPTLAPMIVQGGVDLFTGLIGGLNEVLEKLIPMLPDIVQDIGDTIIDNAPLMIETGFDLLVNLVEGIANAIPDLVKEAAELVPVVISEISDNLPKIIQAGVDLIVAFAESFPDALPAIVEAIPQIISAIITGLTSVDWLATGQAIFKGLADGLTSIFDRQLMEDVLHGMETVLGPAYQYVSQKAQEMGRMLYEALHQEEITANAMTDRAVDLTSDIYYAMKDYMLAGADAQQALEKAKNDFIQTAEDEAIWNDRLADTMAERAATLAKNLTDIGEVEALESAADVIGETMDEITKAVSNTAEADMTALNDLLSGLDAEEEAYKQELENRRASTAAYYDDQISALESSLNDQVEAVKKANAEKLAETKKAQAEETAELKKQQKEQTEELKKQQKEQTDELKKQQKEQTSAMKEAHKEQVNSLKSAQKEELSELETVHKKKLELYDEEYKERLKVIDEEKYNAIKAIEDEIAGIEAKTAAEDAARKAAEQQAKLNELTAKAMNAETYEEQRAAEKELNDYKAELERERILAERQARIDELKNKKTEVEDEFKDRADKLKIEIEQKKADETEAYDLKKANMEQLHTDELAMLQARQDDEIAKLEELHTKQIEDMQAAHDDQMSKLQAEHDDKMNKLQDEHDTLLANMKDAHTQAEKNTKTQLESKLKGLKEEKDVALKGIDDVNKADMDNYKKTLAQKKKEGEELYTYLASLFASIGVGSAPTLVAPPRQGSQSSRTRSSTTNVTNNITYTTAFSAYEQQKNNEDLAAQAALYSR